MHICILIYMYIICIYNITYTLQINMYKCMLYKYVKILLTKVYTRCVRVLGLNTRTRIACKR